LGHGLVAWLVLGFAGCHDESSPKLVTLGLAAYSTPREVYGQKVLPAFAEAWRRKTGQTVAFRESYQGSGAQARAVVAGFDADVVALALEPDVERVRSAGLITHDWKAQAQRGVVTRSIVVIGVRKGNPKHIRDWDDLAKPDVAVLSPDVRTSGGAMWNLAAIYGAALRGHTKAAAGDADAATRLLGTVLRNVKIFDHGARESLLNFERGQGDAIITYENEILLGRTKGHDYEYVVPESTISIECPVALVDGYVERHHNRQAAEAFVDFLWTKEAQTAFAAYGFRPVVAVDAAAGTAALPPPKDLFTIEDLGGWKKLQSTVFDANAAYDRALALAREGL